MGDSLRNLLLHLLRDRRPPEISSDNQSPFQALHRDRWPAENSSARESLFQALKRSLHQSPTDPSRIAACRRGLLYSPTRLSSPDQAILQALAIADHRIRADFDQNTHSHLLSEVISSPDADFSAKRALLELLVSSSSSILHDDQKLFGEIIDGACQQVVTGSTSDCFENLLVSSIIDGGLDDTMMRSAMLGRLLLSTTMPSEEDCLNTYQQAFGEVIFELGEAFPSVESAGVALSAAAEKWNDGRDWGDGHTREEVKRYVSLGREWVASAMRDGFRDGVVKRAVSSIMSSEMREIGKNDCPLSDAVNALSQMNPDSATAKLVARRLILHSKPLPPDLMRSCINHLKRLCSAIEGHDFVDDEEFAYFFAPEVISVDTISSKNDHSHKKIEGPSFSSSQSYLLDGDIADDTNKVLRDALMDAVESLERMSGSQEDKFKNGGLEAIINVFPATNLAPSLNRYLLRQVLTDSREPPSASMVDEAFYKIIFAAVNSINDSTDPRKDLVDYLLDSIGENQINSSSSMKQALVERLVYSCRPFPAEFSGNQILAASIAGGLRRLEDEFMLDQPKEAMAAAITKLPFAGPVVKKTLLLIVWNIAPMAPLGISHSMPMKLKFKIGEEEKKDTSKVGEEENKEEKKDSRSHLGLPRFMKQNFLSKIKNKGSELLHLNKDY